MDTQENPLRTHRKRVISVLLKGKESATQLQTLLSSLSRSGPHSVQDELTLQIYRSFSEALSQLRNCGPLQILPDSADSGHRKSKEPAKARRGCYKRKCSDSKIIVSETMEDDHAWRKYGQKRILNSKYPRCYFRCTHKNSQGCKAIKQVQRVSEDEYNITYFGQHTCKESTIRAPVLVIKSSSISDPYPMVMAVDAAHSPSFECITQDDNDDDDHEHDAVAKGEDQKFKDQDVLTGVLETSGSSGTDFDVDDSFFANLGNLFQSEEMRLLD